LIIIKDYIKQHLMNYKLHLEMQKFHQKKQKDQKKLLEDKNEMIEKMLESSKEDIIAIIAPKFRTFAQIEQDLERKNH